jgi:cell division septation protein DedD
LDDLVRPIILDQMQVRIAVPLTLAVALIGCGGQRAGKANKHLPAAIATPPNDAALLRVSHAGGSAALLRANTLVARPGSNIGGIPAVTRILASNRDDETVYATDNNGKLIAIDLRTERSRVVSTTARQLKATPDGTILGLDSARHPLRLTNRALTTYKNAVEKDAILLRGTGELILVAGNRAGTLQVLNPATEVRHVPMPNGPATATWVGDLVAVVNDSGAVFVDPSGKAPGRGAPPRFVKLRPGATTAAFSPSGHRLYVAEKNAALAIIDRYGRKVLKEVPLPGIASALRPERTGRWMLARGGKDSLWVVDLTRGAVAWQGKAPWADDLPQVVDGRMLLLRDKSDVIAIDLIENSPAKISLAGGAADLFFMLPWVPRGGVTPTNVAAEPPPASNAAASNDTAPPRTAPAAATPPPAPARGTPPPDAAVPPTSPTGTVYLQVSASQNEEWAQALARQLKDGGFPAKVLDPKTSDESYRVVIGPYGSREEADVVGKRLGRSYFIISAGSGDS